LALFLDCDSTVHQEFVSPGHTVNQHYYQEVLQCLKVQVCRKRPEQWRNQDCFIHQDDVLAHTALLAQQFLAAENMAAVSHPPYLSDLAHSDFFLFL
jgi:hypothetical protein